MAFDLGLIAFDFGAWFGTLIFLCFSPIKSFDGCEGLWDHIIKLWDCFPAQYHPTPSQGSGFVLGWGEVWKGWVGVAWWCRLWSYRPAPFWQFAKHSLLSRGHITKSKTTWESEKSTGGWGAEDSWKIRVFTLQLIWGQLPWASHNDYNQDFGLLSYWFGR